MGKYFMKLFLQLYSFIETSLINLLDNKKSRMKLNSMYNYSSEICIRDFSCILVFLDQVKKYFGGTLNFLLLLLFPCCLVQKIEFEYPNYYDCWSEARSDLITQHTIVSCIYFFVCLKFENLLMNDRNNFFRRF